MSSSLMRQRCVNHAAREAAARCLDCRGYLCRECVTEHDDRIVCAICLKTLVAPRERRIRVSLAPIAFAAQALCGLFLAWLAFYFVARSLLSIPAAVHEATLWAAQNL